MELRTGDGERPGRIFLPGGEEAVAIYAGNELVWAKYRASSVDVPRANIVLRAYNPSLYTESSTVVSVPRANAIIGARIPSVTANLSATIPAPRAGMNVIAYPVTVEANRKVEVTVPRAEMIISAPLPTAIGGVSATATVPRANMIINAPLPDVSAKRMVDIQPPRAEVKLSATIQTVYTERKVDIDPVRSGINIVAYPVTVEINERVSADVPRAGIVATAYPPTVYAERAVEALVPRANISIAAQLPTAIGGISVNAQVPRANVNIVANMPNIEVVSLVKQQINKVGRFTYNGSAIPVTGWSSDPTNPGTLVSDSILDVVGSGLATVNAYVLAGRNSTSGVPTLRLVINGVTVDSVDIQPTSMFGNTDPLRGRPTYLQWVGMINEGDDIRLDGLRTISTSGYVNDGSTLSVEPGNKAFAMQRMYKNTSAFTCANSRGIVTGWTADAKYEEGSVVSNQLATTLSGTGTVRAYVAANSGSSPAFFALMMNGVEIGNVTIPEGDQTGYWITVTGITFNGSDLIWLETYKTDPSFTRSTENNSLTVEAFIPNAA